MLRPIEKFIVCQYIFYHKNCLQITRIKTETQLYHAEVTGLPIHLGLLLVLDHPNIIVVLHQSLKSYQKILEKCFCVANYSIICAVSLDARPTVVSVIHIWVSCAVAPRSVAIDTKIPQTSHTL